MSLFASFTSAGIALFILVWWPGTDLSHVAASRAQTLLDAQTPTATNLPSYTEHVRVEAPVAVRLEFDAVLPHGSPP